MGWYIITVIIGIVLDFWNKRDTKNWTKYRNMYIVWLYIFLCFGYMNGSDWRDYEIEYNTIRTDIHYIHNDYGFFYLWYLLSFIFKDYWLMVALLKVVYLTSLIKLTQRITPYWLSAIAFLMPISLVFMLIQNPLRFMVALIFINTAIIFFLNKKYWLFVVLGASAVLFHSTTVTFLLTIPLLKYSERIAKFNRIFIGALYIVVLIISTNANILNSILTSSVGVMLQYYEGMRDFSEIYSLESNESFFTAGSFINIFLFFVVLIMRDVIANKFRDGKFVYGATVIYFFLFRICMMIPTGFRLAIPFGIFYAVYIVYSLKCGKQLAWVFAIYFAVSFPRFLWNSYDLIPYTNSIYYIITEHKPYNERSEYHYNEYYKRTGHSHLDRHK